MVYSQKLVACVKVNGQILRESGDSVSIPFGSEYSILFKNLNSVRVQVKVSIDGKDATEGTWLVIQPNSSIELERFIRNGNLSNGNRLKFIERTAKIEKHRGIEVEDGLIRIEYQTEKVTPVALHVPVVYDYYPHYVPVYPYWPRPWWWGGSYVWGETTYVYNSGCLNSGSIGQNANNVSLATSLTKSAASSSPTRGRGLHTMSAMNAVEKNDAGITVPGSESDQQFHHAAPFQVHDQSEVLVIRLRGEVGGKKVVKAVTVKTKPTCLTCGKKNRATVKYCAECGTALSLI